MISYFCGFFTYLLTIAHCFFIDFEKSGHLYVPVPYFVTLERTHEKRDSPVQNGTCGHVKYTVCNHLNKGLINGYDTLFRDTFSTAMRCLNRTVRINRYLLVWAMAFLPMAALILGFVFNFRHKRVSVNATGCGFDSHSRK